MPDSWSTVVPRQPRLTTHTARTGLPTVKPYVYRGAGPFDARPNTRQAEPEPGTPGKRHDLLPIQTCTDPGTAHGYNRHRRLKEKLCEPCRLKYNLDRARQRGGETTGRKNRKAEAIVPKGQRPPCGTNRGYSFHKRNGEDACAPCRQAHSTENVISYHQRTKGAQTDEEALKRWTCAVCKRRHQYPSLARKCERDHKEGGQP